MLDGAGDDQALKKELAVSDRICSCAVGRSVIAITMYLCMRVRPMTSIASFPYVRVFKCMSVHIRRSGWRADWFTSFPGDCRNGSNEADEGNGSHEGDGKAAAMQTAVCNTSVAHRYLQAQCHPL